ncbi:flavodoxin [Bacteroides ilei]|uniref:flavodoxin n=1 Tax=Bacteroides ilei TaxID=1907658 RepID=UPI0009312AFF|nr:flavodoxin [Bacteroides ilei]
MNKIIMTLAAVMTMSLAACAQNKGENRMQNEHKSLVVYFSATGTTARVARMIADVTDGALYEIVPQQPYTSDDLDWNDRQSRSSVEMNNPQVRPEVKETNIDVGDYDVVFIGYPIWWDRAPRIVNTFIESHDLKNKMLIPFATSGGSGINNSVKELKNTYPNLKWQDGKLLNGSSRNSIQNWTNDVMVSILFPATTILSAVFQPIK